MKHGDRYHTDGKPSSQETGACGEAYDRAGRVRKRRPEGGRRGPGPRGDRGGKREGPERENEGAGGPPAGDPEEEAHKDYRGPGGARSGPLLLLHARVPWPWSFPSPSAVSCLRRFLAAGCGFLVLSSPACRKASRKMIPASSAVIPPLRRAALVVIKVAYADLASFGLQSSRRTCALAVPSHSGSLRSAFVPPISSCSLRTVPHRS